MRVSSSVKPQKVEILGEKKNKVTVALRDNIKKDIEIDLLTEKEMVKYIYDEVKIIARKRNNLIESIKDNFTNWFAKGEKLEQLQQDLIDTKKKIDKLINDGEQIKVNEEYKSCIDISYEAMADLYINDLMLIEDTGKLQEDNLNVMNAVAELYIMVMSGGI